MFRSVTPGGLLGEVVASLWLNDGPGQGADLRLPTGRVELVINIDEDRFRLHDSVYPGAIVAGPYQRAYVLDTAQQSHVVGVAFRPGRARALFDIPLHELANSHVALQDIWGVDATRVREQMLAAPDAATRLRLLGSALRDRLTERDAHPVAAAATTWLSRAPEYPVGQLGDQLGWTARRVQQVFRNDIGFSPKAYQRLQRFRAALTSIDRAAQVGWSAFALERGYYDQAHLVREFQAHMGLSPTAYLQARGRQINHVPLFRIHPRRHAQ